MAGRPQHDEAQRRARGGAAAGTESGMPPVVPRPSTLRLRQDPRQPRAQVKEMNRGSMSKAVQSGPFWRLPGKIAVMIEVQIPAI